MRSIRQATAALSMLALVVCCACTSSRQPLADRDAADASGEQREAPHDEAKAGAAPGAASGAILDALLGEEELDEILAGRAIGSGLGAGVGAYMDRQEEKLARVPGTTVERVAEDMILLHFDSAFLFDVDSALLGAEARSSLDEAAAIFIAQPKTAIIAQGHSDSTGGEEYNRQLSERRAEAVMNHLIDVGVDPARIVAFGYGEGYPVDTNETAEGRARNRRVDLLLKAKAG